MIPHTDDAICTGDKHNISIIWKKSPLGSRWWNKEANHQMPSPEKQVWLDDFKGIPKQYVSLITQRLNHGWHTYSWLCCTINPFHHHWMVYMPQKKKKTTVVVISEYTTPKIPEEDATSTEKEDAATSPEKINETDWYKRLSLSSIPRKSSLSGSHSRRSSTSDAERTFVHFAKSRPRILA
ncbi:hypothetical protein CDAR_44931 [Caerostris darwini]|uniref:Uncharacterized protein n=1 Tax=Caerostris darwini TaxID=1538125 RepID=A0AAV4WR21_9ARAC|nr:hypothetical protein CDAR_44931 [Caerostris darwini]